MLLIHILCNSVNSNCQVLDDGPSSNSKLNDSNSSITSPKSKKSSPKKRAGGSKVSSSSSTDVLSESLSLALLKNLSALLSKFQTEEEALEPLVQLTLRIQPQHISMGANKQRFSSLCQQLKELLVISEGEELIKLICDSLRYLLTGDHSRQQDAQVVIQEAVTEMEAAVLDTLTPKKGKGKKNTEIAPVDSHALELQLTRLVNLSVSVNVTLFSESSDSDLVPKVNRVLNILSCLLSSHLIFYPSFSVFTLSFSISIFKQLEALVVERTGKLSEIIASCEDEDEMLEQLSMSNKIISKAIKLIYSTVLWSTFDVLRDVRDNELDIVSNAEARENVEEDLKEAEAAEEDEGEEPEVDTDIKENIQLVLDRRDVLVNCLTQVMSYHLSSASFDPGDGLPDDIEDLEPTVLAKVCALIQYYLITYQYPPTCPHVLHLFI